MAFSSTEPVSQHPADVIVTETPPYPPADPHPAEVVITPENPEEGSGSQPELAPAQDVVPEEPEGTPEAEPVVAEQTNGDVYATVSHVTPVVVPVATDGVLAEQNNNYEASKDDVNNLDIKVSIYLSYVCKSFLSKI